MSDVKCPYCMAEQEINHDDGYGYEGSETHEQNCGSCNEDFYFETSITFNYNVYCQDGDHKMEPFGDRSPDMYECIKCDFFERREETK